jgi:Protein of unknown function (DUF669)
MPYTTVNFSDVEDFEALPEDDYGIEIDKVEVRRNKADDGDYLNWELVVLDGDYENRRLWMITSLKPTALFRLKQVFDELGVLEGDEMELEYDDDVEVTSSSGPRLLYPDVEGLEATATVKNEMYDGKERNRVEALSTGQSRSKKKASKTTRNSANSSKRSRSRDDDDSKYAIDDDDEDEDDYEEERPSRRSSSATARRSARRDSGRRRLR